MHIWNGLGDGTTWADPFNWDVGTTPTNVDDVTIGDSNNVIAYGATADCNNLTIGSAAALTVSATGVLTIHGNTYDSSGTLNVQDGSTVLFMQSIALNGTINISNSSMVDGTGVTLTINGATSVSGGSTISASLTLDINTGVNFYLDASTFSGNFVADTVRGILTVSGGAAFAPSVGAGSLHVEGEFNLTNTVYSAPYVEVETGGYLLVGSSADLQSGASIATGATLTLTSSTLSTNAVTVEAGGTFTSSNGTISADLNLNSTVGVTLGTNTVTSGPITLTAGTLTFSGGSIMNGSTLNVSGAAAVNFNTSTCAGTVTLGGAQLVTFNGGTHAGTISFASAPGSEVVRFTNSSINRGGLSGSADQGIVTYDLTSMRLTLRSGNPTQTNVLFPVGLSGAAIGL